jgi:acetyl esterase
MGYPSIEEFAEGYFLTKADKQWFRSHFLESEERASDPLVSSLLADLSGLPPALVITAGFDPLRDEGEAFAQRLSDHGVEVEHVCYTDMIHAFVSFAGGIPAGMTALEKIGEQLQRVFSS